MLLAMPVFMPGEMLMDFVVLCKSAVWKAVYECGDCIDFRTSSGFTGFSKFCGHYWILRKSAIRRIQGGQHMQLF